jgi:alpha-tubulin suppressor-like RCC1 family protein
LAPLLQSQIEALSGKGIVKVAAGLFHSMFLDGSGYSLYACGRSDSGQLGQTDGEPDWGALQNVPQRIWVDPRGQPVKLGQIVCGDNQSIAVTADKKSYYAWGYGELGALGLGRKVNEWRPAKMQLANMEGCEFHEVACGGQHTLMVVSTNEGGGSSKSLCSS